MRAYIFILLVLLIGSVTGLVAATRISVGPTDANYTSIGSAINAAHSGDTIEVLSGTYYENVYISKNVTLKGVNTGSGLPVIDAGGYGSVVTLEADGITLEGFNLTHSGHCGCGNSGIRVQSSNNTVVDNIVYKNKYGIYVAQGKNNRFMQNDLTDNNITAYDLMGSKWDGDDQSSGLQGLIESLGGKKVKGNFYSDYSTPQNGCNDTNGDGFCDSPKKIEGGVSMDNHSMVAPVHR